MTKKLIRVFIIPSWYPSTRHPLAGIFVQEQCNALAAAHPELKLVVSCWGHGDLEVRVGDPIAAVRAVVDYLRGPREPAWIEGPVSTVTTPALNWSHRLPKGGVTRLRVANEKNFQAAVDRLGGIDLIHAHVSYPGGYLAASLSKKYDVPFILTEHMGPFPFSTMLKNSRPLPEIVCALERAREVIVVSPALGRQVAAVGFAEPIVIPNLVNEEIFIPGKAVGPQFIFLTLGNLVPQKGIEDLLRAISLWDPPAGQVEFRIGGGGPYRKRYVEMARDLGIDDRVNWLGRISRAAAPRLFQECHSYVLPSRHETFGVVLAEAIACGKPVIATRCGGPESIVNRTNGRLVPVGEPAALVAAMQDMMKYWGDYDAGAIREDFLRRFSREAVTQQIVDVYRSVLG